MTMTRCTPASAEVRERLRAAQRAESVAIAAVQSAQTARTEARSPLDENILLGSSLNLVRCRYWAGRSLPYAVEVFSPLRTALMTSFVT